MGKMASDMNDAANMAWIPTSYMLTSTAFSPIWGNLSDVFGRKIVLITAVLIFMTGSLLCAVSSTMIFLIGSRAIQGIGGGAVVSLVSIVIADLVPLRDSPKYQGLIGGVFSLSSVLGPILGGVFVDQATWRWAFWTQLPIGLLAILSFLFFLKSGTKRVGSSWDRLARIDYWGILCLLITIVTLLLGLSWGGQVYPWKSAPIISLFIISGVFIGITVFVEMKVAKEPICPPWLFTQRNLLSLYTGSFFTGFSFYAVLFYLPVFYQKTQFESATASGLEMLPIILGLSIFSVISGSLVSLSGRFRIFIWIGMFLLTLGAALISTLTQFSPKAMQICYLLITGCGVGLALQTLIVAGQASVQRKDLAAVTSLLTFWRTIGGVLGTGLCGTIYQNALQSNLSTLLDPKAFAKIVSKSGADFSKASSFDEVARVVEAYTRSLQLVYRTFVGFAALALFATLFLQHKEMGFGAKKEENKTNRIEPFEKAERTPKQMKRQSELKMEREKGRRM
ncbi:major facilitator superfamily domain-containing protein [Jimgerdemannia flammicorona]|uniref:Major facilitator superfamily domain-containing protein n=1 Tax=Jimgerdemannia flammicorona TaxID=994334 RepID=A0A433QN70_9FUNG|nr:major facilitator superfamily domain-containing protein [Jimgerdemannia flammicorona]